MAFNIPIPFHSHSRLTNEQHLSLNNIKRRYVFKMQTLSCFSLKISTQKFYVRISYFQLSLNYKNTKRSKYKS